MRIPIRSKGKRAPVSSIISRPAPVKGWNARDPIGAMKPDEAIMLDLEQEPDINIAKALRPIQLPPVVYEYLSPRKRVTYYFDADSRKAPQS